MAAATVAVPTSFPALVSPSHRRYSSTIGSLDDSYARTAAAQQRRAAHQQQQTRRDARLAQQAQQTAQQQLDRQFLFREHILATVNHSKTKRIRLECKSGLRSEAAAEDSADWPRFDTVDVRVEEWRCSGAKTRVLEEEGWRDEARAQVAAEKAAGWQQRDRELERQKRQQQRQQRHAAIHAQFMQQREVNVSRAAYIRHHFADTQPYNLTPPASYLDSVSGRISRVNKRDGEERDASGRCSVLSSGRSGATLPQMSHRSFSAAAQPPTSKRPSGRARPSHTQPSLPSIRDEQHAYRRHAPRQPALAAVTAKEQRQDEYDDSSFDADASVDAHHASGPNAATSLNAPGPADATASLLDPASPLHACGVRAPPAPVLSSAVDGEMRRFEGLLPAVRAREKRPLYLTSHHRQQH